MLLDGVHFELDKISPRLAGRKAVAVNLSDLAAMACFPTAAFISIAVPKTMKMPGSDFLDDLYGGIESLTKQYDFTLAGGDTNSWNGPFAINVCLTGSPMKDRPCLRSGARPGDHLFVTGPLGGSLKSGRHLTFEPRLEFARWLIEHTTVHAMMDLSDGLSVDLPRMMEASNTGAILQFELIPVHNDVPEFLSRPDRTLAALTDGEDFELLISVNENDPSILIRTASAAGVSLYKVGEVAQQQTVLIQDDAGHARELKRQGWIHQWQ
jgi:thiamine-monophosphate kinase